MIASYLAREFGTSRWLASVGGIFLGIGQERPSLGADLGGRLTAFGLRNDRLELRGPVLYQCGGAHRDYVVRWAGVVVVVEGVSFSSTTRFEADGFQPRCDAGYGRGGIYGATNYLFGVSETNAASRESETDCR